MERLERGSSIFVSPVTLESFTGMLCIAVNIYIHVQQDPMVLFIWRRVLTAAINHD